MWPVKSKNSYFLIKVDPLVLKFLSLINTIECIEIYIIEKFPMTLLSHNNKLIYLDLDQNTIQWSVLKSETVSSKGG